jgi:hypothetical protein
LQTALQLLSQEGPAGQQQQQQAGSSSSSGVQFSVREAFKWLARYAADASGYVHSDEQLKKYLKVRLSMSQ